MPWRAAGFKMSRAGGPCITCQFLVPTNRCPCQSTRSPRLERRRGTTCSGGCLCSLGARTRLLDTVFVDPRQSASRSFFDYDCEDPLRCPGRAVVHRYRGQEAGGGAEQEHRDDGDDVQAGSPMSARSTLPWRMNCGCRRHFLQGDARKAAKAVRQLPGRPVDTTFTGFTPFRLAA